MSVEDKARERAYEQFKMEGDGAMGDLDLRAAAQHAQVIGDRATEREIDDTLTSRELRGAR